MVEVAVKPLEELLGQSSAAPPFKDAVINLADGLRQNLIKYNWGSPPVKVLRVVMKLLEDHPELPIKAILIEGKSGCSDYVGHAVVQPGNVRFEFEWNCLWRAEQLGWTDAFGDPDQIRAAQTYGYQCFRRLEKVAYSNF